MQAPYSGRARLSREGAMLRITIPIKGKPLLTIFLLVWLVGWFVGLLTAGGFLMSGSFPLPAMLFIGVWLTAWTAGGGFALFVVLWQFFGREIIEMQQGLMTIRYKLGPFKRSKTYDLQHVRNVAVSPKRQINAKVRPGRSREVWGLGGGSIKFDYGMKTLYCGRSIEEAEARELLHLLHKAKYLNSSHFGE